jgi:hypothetical protein
MNTRAPMPASGGHASPASDPPGTAVPALAPAAPPAPPAIVSWSGDADALSEFPTEADVKLSALRAKSSARKPTPAPAARPRPVWLAGLAVLVVAAILFAAWRWRSTPPVPAEKPAAAIPTGTLSIESTPTGATVVINGEDRGSTPLTLTLAAGTYSVGLRAAGRSRELSVSVAAGTKLVHHVELGDAAPSTGRLSVASTPAGATVVLDGARRGVTPIELSGLAPGDHAITVGDGGTAVSQRVSVPAGGLASLVVPLAQPQAGAAPGWVSVDAPFELQVFADNELVGTSGSERVLMLAGRHSLRLVSAALDFETTRAVLVGAGRVTTVRVDVPNGALNVNAQPWAEVFLDGRRIGETPIANYPVPIGPHELTLRNPRFPEQKRSVVVKASAPIRVGVDLRQ